MVRFSEKSMFMRTITIHKSLYSHYGNYLIADCDLESYSLKEIFDLIKNMPWLKEICFGNFNVSQ